MSTHHMARLEDPCRLFLLHSHLKNTKVDNFPPFLLFLNIYEEMLYDMKWLKLEIQIKERLVLAFQSTRPLFSMSE